MPKWGAAALSIRASGAAWKARVTGYTSSRHPRMTPALLSAAVTPEPHASHDSQHHPARSTAGRLPTAAGTCNMRGRRPHLSAPCTGDAPAATAVIAWS